MDEQERKKAGNLIHIAMEYCVFVDSSVLVNAGFAEFAARYEKYRVAYYGYSVLFVPNEVWKKLNEAAADKNNKKSSIALKNIDILNALALKKIACQIPGREHFEGLFESWKNKDVKICVLTQDGNAADELGNKPVLKQFREYQIRRLNQAGYVTKHYNCKNSYAHQSKCEVPLIIPKEIKILPQKQLFIPRIPEEGDRVVIGGKEERVLFRKIERVSDGIICDIGNGLYAKIFDRANLDVYHQAKCEEMVKMKVRSPFICWPIHIVQDQNRRFLGYTFFKYAGQPLQSSVMKRAGLKQYFPDWEKADIVRLAITILREIDYLHEHNILIGCLDMESIRIIDPDTVYFTNTDAYQVEGFPCLLRNRIFLPPERIDYADKIFLFSEKTENYLVSVLVFMLMMPGKFPYDRKAGKDSVRAIKSMQFPYAYKENRSKGVESSFWRFVWSHLHVELKRMFYETFQMGEAHNRPVNREGTKKWLSALNQYCRDLETGEFLKIDDESAKMFPDTFRKARGVEYVRCSVCGKEFPQWLMNKEFSDICRICSGRPSETYFDCECCKRRFYYSISEERAHQAYDWKPQRHCIECKRVTLCAKCGKPYKAYQLREGRCYDCNRKLR